LDETVVWREERVWISFDIVFDLIFSRFFTQLRMVDVAGRSELADGWLDVGLLAVLID
jgi:hypothetical protein